MCFFFLIAALFACEKPIIEPPLPPPPPPCGEPCDTTVLKFLWQAPIGADTGDYFSPQPMLYNGNLAITKMFGGPYDIVMFRDGQDGNLIWDWDNPIDIPSGESIGGVEKQKIYQNKLILSASHEINVVDMNTGIMLWRSDTQDKGGSGGVRIALINDHIYHTHKPPGTFVDSSYLVRSSVHQPKWDTIFRLGLDEQGRTPSIQPGVLWVSPQGDSVYIFQNRGGSNSSDQVDLYALNIQTLEVLWKIDSLDTGSCVRPPLVRNGKVYFSGYRNVFCIDAATGSILWKYTVASGLFNTDLIIAENKLIVHPNLYSTIAAVDLDTGAEIWKKTNTGDSPTDIEYYHGHIFYASGGDGYIYVHRVSDGNLVKKLRSPNREKYGSALFTRPLNIDPANGRLYCTDGRFAICYQIKL